MMYRATSTIPSSANQYVAHSVSEHFEQTVARHGSHLAVVDGATSWSYATLAGVVNRIALGILNQAEEGNEPVGLLFGHEALSVASIFAVLRAGRAYVALDPYLPSNRNQALLDSVNSRLVLTDSQHLEKAVSIAGPSRSVLDVTAISSSSPHQVPSAMPAPDTLAAIYFTSGSTGKPKGVLRTHADLLRRVQIDHQMLGYNHEDVFSILYGYSYAGSISDLFGGVLAGGTLQLYDVKQLGIQPLADWINRQRITHLHINSTLMRSLLEQLPPGTSFPTVRQVRPSQRLLTLDVQALWKVLTREAVIFHQYAGTETGPVCSFKIDRHTFLEGDVVPPGKAVPGVEVMIYRDEDSSSDDSSVGEIVVSSPYIASGYWPSSPSDVLRENPFHTGDLGRLHPDGWLELIGRKDFQVKIRGYRVEIEEVEIAVERLGAVHQAVVVAESDSKGEKRLIAYVVPVESGRLSTQSLRTALRQVLPEHMIPSRFLVLDALPLLPNGKIDRRALLPPGNERPDLTTPFLAPRTPLEAKVAAIWAEVIGFDQVGVRDTFLDLGGHSLQAARIVSRVIHDCQVDLPMSLLFTSPTVADMVLMITQQQAAQLDQGTLERLLAELDKPVGSDQSENG